MSEAIDLSKLPSPAIIESIEYETLLAERKADMKARLDAAGILPDWDSSSESDPIVKSLEESAYREVVLRQRVNDAAYATMLAYAEDDDLDQIGARYDVERLTVTPADTTTTPPTAAVMESNERFRERIQLAFEGFTTAGPIGAYRYNTLSASAKVKSCSVTRPKAGTVRVTVLSTEGDGTADEDLLATVLAALSDEDIRPLNDTVEVKAAEIIGYQLTAQLVIGSGPDKATVLATSLKAAGVYVAGCHVVDGVVARSGIDKALHQSGVTRVILTEPAADIIASQTQAPYCLSIDVTVAADG